MKNWADDWGLMRIPAQAEKLKPSHGWPMGPAQLWFLQKSYLSAHTTIESCNVMCFIVTGPKTVMPTLAASSKPWLCCPDVSRSSEQNAMTVLIWQTHLDMSRCGFTRESSHFHVYCSPGKSRLRPSAEQVHLTAPQSWTLICGWATHLKNKQKKVS